MSEVDLALHRKVQEVSNLVIRLSEQVGSVSGQVSTVEANQHQTRTELQQLRDEFLAFVKQAEATAHVQRAETRIGAIEDKIDHEFGHHKTVRRTAVGMLQAFDVGLVSEENVRMVGDQLMLQTPRYWLAPALVALASWSADDRTLCDRAVDEAFRRSPDRTSLFFALVLRRQGRSEAAVRWLRHYLLAQDPAALGREFAVILEAIAQGAFGLVGRELLDRTLAEWRSQLMDSADAQAKQVRRWRDELESLRGPSQAAEFPRLAVLSPQWVTLDGVLSSARGQQPVLDKYKAVMDREFRPSERIEDAVDDILDRLVSEYDNEELPLRRDLAFNQAVVDHDGDLATARKTADADSASYEETLDYLTVQTTAALNPQAIGTSPATQRLSVAACHDWFQQAHAAHTRDYRAAVPQDVQAQFAATHTVGAQHFQLPTWVGSFTQPLAALEKSLGDHWDHYTRPFVDALAFPWLKKVAPLAGVVAAILLFLAGSWPGFAIGAAAIVAVVWGLILRNQAQTAARAQDAARELLERAKTESLHQLRGVSAELTDWYEKFTAADRVEAKVRELIATLPTAGGGASPFEGRTVGKKAAADPAPAERPAPEPQAAWRAVPESRLAKEATPGAKESVPGAVESVPEAEGIRSEAKETASGSAQSAPADRRAPEPQAARRAVPEPRPAQEAAPEAQEAAPETAETSPQPKETAPEPQEDSAR
ncbi:hypothetical protein J2Z21_002259 [Streptomyces griseochromogenes]|uniref:Uncharacterized protein n=1 Tax=Streptomyces griseochromogenes TaxID=68214 RepID=A0ABS4LPJ4_9ACTN|nr:hypothetical protein [Streptomyces griseochromogenes]MBP2049328.1 hypothetical protein [Streptomyces griseochromogenes]